MNVFSAALSPDAAPPARRRRRGAVVAIALLSLVVPLLATGTAAPAFAAGETLEVAIGQVDGTPAFDATDGAGLDSGDANGIIRTNDTITYNVELRVEGGTADNATFTLTLPLGYELDAIPAVCTGPSSLTPASLPAPVQPLTATSYQALTPQVLVCNVGTRTAGSTLTYPVVARVRSEVPNGTASGPVTALGTSDAVTVPVVSNQVSSTVSAAPKWDLSKNNTALQEDSGYFFRTTEPCVFDTTRTCLTYDFPILIGSDNAGKGTTPLSGAVTFTDDLSPESFFPAGTTTSTAWLAAGAGALDKYAPRLRACDNASVFNAPGVQIGAGDPLRTEVNSVRKSGTPTCSQPGGPGTAAQVTITGADTSLYTFPTEARSPVGTVLPGEKAYAISQRIRVTVPADALTDLGLTVGSNKSLSMVNKFEDFDVTGLDGVSKNVDGANDPSNDYRSIVATSDQPGAFVKQFIGVPGTPGNTPASDFNPSFGWAEGPPSNNTARSGQITVAPGQIVLSGLLVRGSSSLTNKPGTVIACDAWDPDLLTLTPGNYPSQGNIGQRYPSNGAAVWRSGDYFSDTTTDYTIEYSTGAGGSGDASTCGTGTWFDNPEDVPGGITAVSRVRIWVEMSSGPTIDINETFFSIALKVSESATAGEIIPNWAGVMFHFGDQPTLEQMLADPANVWRKSSYNPADHSGGLGDRLIAAPAIARIVKTVKGPAATTFSKTVPAVTGNDQVEYQLAPTLTSSAATTEVSTPVWIEDCIPAGQTFQSASITPSVVSATTPAGAGLTCAARETYVRFDLGSRVPNQPIDPIIITVKVSPVASSGTYTNKTLISSDGDLSTVAQRDDTAQIQIVQPAGVQIDKVPLTPLVEVNRDGETTKDPLRWRIDLANIQAPGTLTAPDLIDVLPKNGVNATSFTGDLEFASASVVTGGSNVAILYTKKATFAQDPSDPTNGASGSTVWCSSASGGSVVSGSGTAADCPASADEVTGLRVKRPGAFLPGDVISVQLSMIPTGNAEGDVYVNRTFGRVNGLVLPVGPVDAPERVIASEVGDFVWNDLNSNGIQDAGEPGVAGVPVTISGTDADGNDVTQSTVTDANGNYTFSNLPSGTYVVTFDPDWVADHNFAFTLRGEGTDPQLNSDADPETGESGDIELGVDEARLDIDAGLVQLVGGLVIEKTVSGVGAAAAAGPFEFSVLCTYLDQTVYDGPVTLERPAGETTFAAERIGGIPVGASCVVTETGTGGADAAPAPVTVDITLNDDENTVTADFENEFSAGTIGVHKELEGTAADRPDIVDLTFSIQVTCQIAGVDGAEPTTVYSGVLQVKGGETAWALDENGDAVQLPVGAVCFGSETETGGADEVVVDHNSFETGIAVEAGSPDDVQQLLITATNTFDQKLGGLEIEKQLTGAGVADAVGPFEFSVVCTYFDETVYDETVTLERAADETTLTSDRIDDLPVGAFCVVTETDNGGADATPAPVTVVIEQNSDGDTVTASFVNQFSSGTIAVTKVLTGTAAGNPDVLAKTFTVQVTCQLEVDGQTQTLFSGELQVKGGETVYAVDENDLPIRLPLGTICFGDETDTNGADDAVVDHDSLENGVAVQPGSPDTVQQLLITATNTFDQKFGGLVIAKELDGAGAPVAAGPFGFSVLCTYLGATVFDGTVTIQRAGDELALTSARVGDLPVGASCVVTETDNGGADTTPAPVTVLIVLNDDDNTVTAGFVNEFSAGTIGVHKTLTGTAAGTDAVKAKVFTVQVTCRVELDGVEEPVTVYSGVLLVKGGETVTALDSNGAPVLLPLGSVCFGAETETGGADKSVVDHGSFENGIIVESGAPDDLQQLLIMATNTFDDKPVTPPTPTKDTPVAQPGTGSLPTTGLAVGGTLGLVALLLAAGVLLVLRRRTRHSE